MTIADLSNCKVVDQIVHLLQKEIGHFAIIIYQYMLDFVGKHTKHIRKVYHSLF